MARIAVAADRSLRVVGILLAAAFLRELLAVAPVTHQLAVRWPFDRDQVDLLDLLGDVFWQRFARVLGARLLRFVLVEAVHAGLAARLE